MLTFDVLSLEFKNNDLIKFVGFFSIANLVVFILNGIVNSNLKEIFVFWKIKERLPGFKSFSVIAKKDPRVDIKYIENRYGTLPNKPIEQNRLWYKIYKNNENVPFVFESHRLYILNRDLCCLSLIVLVLYLVCIIIDIFNRDMNLIYFITLIFQYVVLVVCARNYCLRFVSNVLASEMRAVNK